MLIFSEYQTGTIDLLLDFYGYEDCQPNYSFGPAIRDGFVLHFITKGKGVFHYKGEQIFLKAGDLFLLKPNELTYYKADFEDPWSYYWLGISGTKVSDYFNLSEIGKTGFLRNSSTSPTDSLGKFIIDIIQEAEHSQSTMLSHLQLLAMLYELLFKLGKLAPNQQLLKQQNSTYQLYIDTKRILETRYPLEQLSIQGIANELNVNRSYLTTIFKEYNGLSPKEYLHYIRMHRAKQLLESTREPIQFIAYSVGFSDPLYFSKAFKKYFGFSLSSFREQS